MEKLRRIAKAHYEAGSPKTKELARHFFDSMDDDGNGEVSLKEFTRFMAEEGHKEIGDEDFFDLVDLDGNGTLDFWEVMTLYYIITSGRRFCGSCKEFLVDVYFACVECYESPQGAFCICLRCYSDSSWANHTHSKRPRFLDTYTLLEIKRVRDMSKPKPTNVARMDYSAKVPSPKPMVRTMEEEPSPKPKVCFMEEEPYPSSSNAMVLARPAYNNKFSARRAAFKTFQAALMVGNIASNLSYCSVM